MTDQTLLESWLREADPARAAALLDAIMRTYAEPLIRRIVGFKLAPGRNPESRCR